MHLKLCQKIPFVADGVVATCEQCCDWPTVLVFKGFIALPSHFNMGHRNANASAHMGADTAVRESTHSNHCHRVGAIGKFQPCVTVATGTGVAGTVQICRVSFGVRIIDCIAPVIGHPVGIARTQVNGERKGFAFPTRVKRFASGAVFHRGVRRALVATVNAEFGFCLGQTRHTDRQNGQAKFQTVNGNLLK